MGEAGGRRVVAEPLPHVVAVEALPDGRKVMVFDDRGTLKEIVFGIAAKSAPVAPRVSLPDRRANELLESLLDAEQLASWRRDGTFWVESRRGPVQLGRLYSLLHHPVDRPDEEVVLCVVPEGHGTLPRADIWSNLVLVLSTCPDAFFDVANVLGIRRRPDPPDSSA